VEVATEYDDYVIVMMTVIVGGWMGVQGTGVSDYGWAPHN
jgi:hypothetical protein